MLCQISLVLGNLNKLHFCTLYLTQLYILAAKAVCLAVSAVAEFAVDAAEMGERSLREAAFASGLFKSFFIGNIHRLYGCKPLSSNLSLNACDTRIFT